METVKPHRMTLIFETEYINYLDILNDQDDQNLLVRFITQPCHPGYEDMDELPVVKTKGENKNMSLFPTYERRRIRIHCL